MRKINIAVDGPAGSGKGTVSKLTAKELGYKYVDSGVMYRLLTYLIVKNNIDIDDDDKINEILINEFDYEIDGDNVYFNDEDVTKVIRSSEVNSLVSSVASKRYVREFFVKLLKMIASEKGVVMDGRDITTVVLNDAELKIYLDASLEERVNRRYKEEIKKNSNVTFEEVKKNIEIRDRVVIEGNILVRSDDSVLVDTTGMSIDDVVTKVVSLAKGVIGND